VNRAERKRLERESAPAPVSNVVVDAPVQETAQDAPVQETAQDTPAPAPVQETAQDAPAPAPAPVQETAPAPAPVLVNAPTVQVTCNHASDYADGASRYRAGSKAVYVKGAVQPLLPAGTTAIILSVIAEDAPAPVAPVLLLKLASVTKGGEGHYDVPVSTLKGVRQVHVTRPLFGVQYPAFLTLTPVYPTPAPVQE
jgi:hypothetical protein